MESEANQERDHGALEEETYPPALERIKFALTVSAAFDQRPARMSQVTGQVVSRPYHKDFSSHAEHGAHDEESSDSVDLYGSIVRVGFDLEVRNGKALSDIQG